jgi:2-dehydropantoate 2-reductase
VAALKNILIVGTGALGTLFAGRLALIGVNVTLLGTWKNAIEAFNRQGARLIPPDGSILRLPVRATDDPLECDSPDLALVLVKAWQTARAARQLKQCLPEHGLAVTLQNGLGNREILSASLGLARVAQGVTTTGATLLGPGQARVAGEGLISLETHARSPQVADLLRAAGFQVELVPDLNALLWGKLVVNAAINPLTALLRVSNGKLLERPAARLLMAELARETATVASALGIRLPFIDPVIAAEEVARRTAANHSSMLQDVERGAPTEIDAICGAIVRAGDNVGVAVPVNRMMWQLLSSLDDSD